MHFVMDRICKTVLYLLSITMFFSCLNEIEHVDRAGVDYLNSNLTIGNNMKYLMSEVEPGINYYVTLDGAGTRDGLNWSNAFSMIDMLRMVTLSNDQSDATYDAQFDALSGAIFHMAAGSYDWGANATISINEDEVLSFIVKGGYNPSTGERDLENHVTVFTGNNNHQIFALGGNMNVGFDGVNFFNGYVDGNGGGLHITSGSWAFARCKFSENESTKNGGAISISGGSLVLEDCDFINNVALNDNADRTSGNGYGGAIDSDGAVLIINGGTFSGNVAWKGGALSIYNCDSEAIIENVIFSSNGNENTRDAGAVYAAYPTNFHNCEFISNQSKYGAGIYVQRGGQDNLSHVYGCVFTNNTASGNGGAISVAVGANVSINSSTNSVSEFIGNSAAQYGGALNIETSDSNKDNKIKDAIFKGNYSRFGGAVEIYGNLNKSTTKVYFSNCTFGGPEENDSNYATHATDEASGGVMFIEDDTFVNISHSTFMGNHCDNKGGAICVEGWGVLQLYRDTFIGNYGYTGGALYTDALHSKYPDCFIDECSFDGNYITNSYGAVFNVNGVNNFGMYNSSVRGSYTTNNNKKTGLSPSWMAIDRVQNTSSITNCSIIGDIRRLRSNGVDFEILTNNTALIAVWGDNHYFTNNIIIPESNGIASIGGEGSDQIDLNYNLYNTVIGVDATDSGGNSANITSLAIDGLQWSNEDCNSYYWKWDGTINISCPYMTNQSNVTGRVRTFSSDFASWCGNDLNMDQRNVIRDYSKWWPGAYQGHVDGDYIYLNVTTYNVLKPDASARHTTKMSMDNPDVRNALAQTIASTQSDIIGFGELDETHLSGGVNDLAELCSSINDYTWYLDWPNKINISDSLSPTYTTSYSYSEGFAYNSAKLDLLESGYVWLSKSQETWYTSVQDAYGKVGNPARICVWTKMKHKDTGKVFWVFVTHLPTEGQGGQENMANVVNEFAQFKSGSEPAILLGDMNAHPSTTTYAILTDYWMDGNNNDWGTMSGSSSNYHYSVETFTTGRTDRRIDHILTKGCTATSYRFTPVTYEVDGEEWCPSDHLPVTATISIQ